jgi:hypothetical protein
MISKLPLQRCCRIVIPLLLLTAIPIAAGYKFHRWNPRAIESYPSKLTSEGITIAIDPLFTDALAAQVFDKNDIVTRGIMPLAVIIFNSNNFPIEVESTTIELLQDGERLRGMDPLEAVQRLYETKPNRVVIPSPIPIPKLTILKSNADACQDFKQKFLALKRVMPNTTAGGFLFLPVTQIANLRETLAAANIYIPHIYRGDNGGSMMFFEIELQAAMDAAARK